MPSSDSGRVRPTRSGSPQAHTTPSPPNEPRGPSAAPLRQVLDRTYSTAGREFLERLLESFSEGLDLDLVWLEIGPEEGVAEGGPSLRLCRPASIVPPFEVSEALMQLEPGQVHFLDGDSEDGEADGLVDTRYWDTLGGVPFTVDGVGCGVLAFADAGEVDPLLLEPYLIELLAQRLATESRRVLDERWLHGGLGRDPQTGLPGRRLFLDRVGGAIQRSLRTDQRTVLIDIAIGDGGLEAAAREALMVAVGGRLRGAVRSCDAVGRLATARFGVLLEGVREWRYVEAVALSVYHALTHTPLDDGQRVQARAGVAVFPDDGPDGLMLLEKARRTRLERDDGLSFASVGGWR